MGMNLVSQCTDSILRTNKCASGLEHQDAQSRVDAQIDVLADGQYQKYVSTGSHRLSYQRFVRHIIPQPLAAYIGLLGCLLLVAVSSSVWWDVGVSRVSKTWSASVYILVSSPSEKLVLGFRCPGSFLIVA